MTDERQARAGPLLDALRAWPTAMLARVPGRGGLAGAIRCALTRWAALARRRGGGRLAMDGNAAGRPIRPPTLGRKNRLLCGSNAGGSRAAGMRQGSRRPWKAPRWTASARKPVSAMRSAASQTTPQTTSPNRRPRPSQTHPCASTKTPRKPDRTLTPIS